jgi:RHS repeat-associated protein
VNFKYDPFGRRIQKNSTNYVYEGANVIEEVDQSGNLLARYSQGVGIDEPLGETRSGATSYYEQDGLGSVTSLSSSGGSLSNTYAYDSFGNLATSSGTVTNPFQYTGRDYDPETGLRYYRARYYDPSAGRFISEDPIKFFGGMNFYVYAGDSPTGFSDPSGLRRVPIPPDALDKARMLLSNPECARFIKNMLRALGQPEDLDALLNAFNRLKFELTPNDDPYAKDARKQGYTAHVDVLGVSSVVHVDHPERPNLPVTMMHETFHTIYYGYSDYSIAHAVGYDGTKDDAAASAYFSHQMEAHCKDNNCETKKKK